MVGITLRDVTLTYEKAERPAVEGLDLEIRDGEFLVLVGPSGCGKSTTLRMLAGLELPDSGQILFGDRDVTAVPGRGRDVAMVFQNYGLYPHMTVSDNMSFALKNLRVPKAERAARVLEAARMLDMDQYLDRKPRELSGGQRQRVAMGRAIVRQPEVFLMDEPLSNLDAKLRVQTRAQISALQRRLGVTTVYVTHDQTEAMTMGDRVVVMNGGRIEQIGTPRELYDNPRTLFVAGFIGSPMMNLLAATVEDPGTVVVDGLRLPRPRGVADDAELIVGIRPEDLRVAPGGADAPGIALEVAAIEDLGADSYVHATLVTTIPADGSAAEVLDDGADATDDGGETVTPTTSTTMIVRFDKGSPVVVGDRIVVTADPSSVRFFDAATGLAVVPAPADAVGAGQP
ncbi:sugar ABC transporter ATP-binding protein [Pseudoclavibacter endophyticus]|uniref:sn-glycerol-3-phosphate ABC transporter ATP-binding protein UgpC n=1 Tax=Pseudoclavibacter endophyticus TaxID=1778590 RepID=A0A6H9WRR4_9MICO|nr:sn-glycerol-3-phosphate ABC transporter ATP-binding protein UgpC [Pseudoclavibacter endophyticus]KAB1650311.1 sn-glycerol-3-phosphate ABC transporter ATP-binding protein UgpC [Pseudoclavibacter endophyticus]GGA55232.1 sugar ABC transporter ATP-binding protein [Pseudoclavibacter endophyticus]